MTIVREECFRTLPEQKLNPGLPTEGPLPAAGSKVGFGSGLDMWKLGARHFAQLSSSY